MVRIPSEYQEVEYIESTGEQWIDTLYIPTIDTTAFVKFLAVEKNNAGYFGARRDPYHFCCTTYSNGTTFGLNINKSRWTSNRISLELNKIYECEFKNGYSKINNIEYYEEAEEGWPSNANIGTFVLAGKNASGVINANFTTKAKYYDCKLWENNSLVRNLIPCYRKSDNKIGMYDTVTKQFYTNSGTGTFLKGNDVTYDNINLLESRRRILLNTPHIESISDAVASFNTDVAANLKECKIYFTPIQEGEGDPSPENVRPIKGWDGVTVNACGKNLAANGIYCGRLKVTNNVYVGSVYYCYYFPIPKAPIYITKSNKNIPLISVSMEPPALNVPVISSGIPTMTNVRHYIFDNTEIGAKYMCIHGFNDSAFADLKVLLDNAELMITTDGYNDTYEASENDLVEITIPFPQTIYGGYVDLVKGEVVEEWISKTFDGSEDENWIQSSIQRFYTSMLIGDTLYYERQRNTHIKSDILESLASSSLGQYSEKVCWTNSGYTIGVRVNTDTNSVELLKQWLNENPIVIAQELRTPNIYTIDHQTLKALRGMNNIWSDANGNVEVSFYTH